MRSGDHSDEWLVCVKRSIVYDVSARISVSLLAGLETCLPSLATFERCRGCDRSDLAPRVSSSTSNIMTRLSRRYAAQTERCRLRVVAGGGDVVLPSRVLDVD